MSTNKRQIKARKQKKGQGRVQRVPRPFGAQTLPPWRTIDMTYVKSNVINNVGGTQANFGFQPTDPRYVDEAQLATYVDIPMWTSMQQQYRQFRVDSARIKVTYVNQEAFPVHIALGSQNYAIAQNDATFDTLYGQPTTKRTVLGSLTGMSRATLTMSRTTASFAGARLNDSVDFYCGNSDPTGARPTNKWDFFVGILSNDPLTATGGVSVNVEIAMRVRFFELNAQLS